MPCKFQEDVLQDSDFLKRFFIKSLPGMEVIIQFDLMGGFYCETPAQEFWSLIGYSLTAIQKTRDYLTKVN